MKFLVEIRIPTEVGNTGLLDGSMLKQQQKYMEDVKADKLPGICEPLWLDWKAEVHLTPVMTGEDFEKACPELKKVLEVRK